MKIPLLILIGVALIAAIIHIALPGNPAPEQSTQQSTSQEKVGMASSNTSTNLHFEIQINPQM